MPADALSETFDRQAGSSATATTAGALRVRRCQPLLGTFVEIDATAESLSPHELEAAVDVAFGCISKVQALMSFHDPSSELSQLNRSAHEAPCEVHPWTVEVLRNALHFSQISDGYFDVTIAPTLVSWGFLPAVEGRLHKPAKDANWRDVEIPGDRTVSFRRPLHIDLGGIAKGYAVDKAATALAEKGVRTACVNAGGDLRFLGPWPGTIGIRRPHSPWNRSVELPVLGRAIATSAGYFKTRRRWWRQLTHLMDPKRRTSVAPGRSATVFAPSCMQADALAKIALLAPAEVAHHCFHVEQAQGVLLDASGEPLSICVPVES